MCVDQTPLLWTEPRNRNQRKWKTSLNLQLQRKTMTTQLQAPTGERSVSTTLTIAYDLTSWLPDIYLQKESKQPCGWRHSHVRWSKQLHPSRDRRSCGRKLKARNRHHHGPRTEVDGHSVWWQAAVQLFLQYLFCHCRCFGHCVWWWWPQTQRPHCWNCLLV